MCKIIMISSEVCLLKGKFCSSFRTNFLKICVLKVIQESSKHLDKILNVDEIVRRIYTVIHANDPVARAITLRYSMIQLC